MNRFNVNKKISSFTMNRSSERTQAFCESEVQYSKLNLKKIIDESWDFRKANTKEYTHCFHTYPAMMIPQVARRIIENYGNKSELLFDPYCGTGTSLVEANLKGINAIGTDINPLARLIAKTKTTRINIEDLDRNISDFINFYLSSTFAGDPIKSILIPEVKNIDYWFSKRTQEKLGLFRWYIENIKTESVKNFFKVAFSETVRESSFIRQGEFKLVRVKNLNEKNDVDIFNMMMSKLERNKQGLINFMKDCKESTYTHVYDFNTVHFIPSNLIKPNSIDIVVTSPPYGDSRTTVAYGQYSRLANEWLGYKEAGKIDKMLMGGKKLNKNFIFQSEILNDVIQTIKKVDGTRVKDVVSFYIDYEKSIKNVAKTLKSGGVACYVVGNRTVKGCKIPNDEITAQLFEYNGFIHIETIVRNIPNKRMPLKNSPSNIAGKTASTIKNEYIVICQKK